MAAQHASWVGRLLGGRYHITRLLGIGTPQYQPPELLTGQRGDGRADQFGLAVTVYGMVGKVPDYLMPPPMASEITRAFAKRMPADKRKDFLQSVEASTKIKETVTR